jgi:hypothetical protein
MRINEIIVENEVEDVEGKILTVLAFLKQKQVEDIPTADFITLVRHAGAENINYESLVSMNDSSQKIKNIINTIDKTHITLRNDNNTQVKDNDVGSNDPTVTVSNMAKSALDNRS